MYFTPSVKRTWATLILICTLANLSLKFLFCFRAEKESQAMAHTVDDIGIVITQQITLSY